MTKNKNVKTFYIYADAAAAAQSARVYSHAGRQWFSCISTQQQQQQTSRTAVDAALGESADVSPVSVLTLLGYAQSSFVEHFSIVSCPLSVLRVVELFKNLHCVRIVTIIVMIITIHV